MSTGRIDSTHRSAPVRKAAETRPLDEPAKEPKRPAQTDRLSLQSQPGKASGLSDVVAAAKSQNQKLIGNAVVDGARTLHTRGYVYPPDLGANYYHKYNDGGRSVGCCADFVCDSYKEMSKSLGKPQYDIGAQMEAKGYNPHYCPSMIQYFQKEQTLLPAPKDGGKAHVGDVVFFDWDGNGKADPDHVAVVTKVDAQGNPTELMESRHFNSPSEITTMTPGDRRWNCIVGIGRLKDATSDDEAANALPPIGPSSAPGDAGSRGSANPTVGGGAAGNGGSVAHTAPSDVRTSEGKATNYQPFHKTEFLQNLAASYGVAFDIMKQLADALASDSDMTVDQLAQLAEKKGVPKEKAQELAKKLMEKKAELKKAGAASPDTAKLMGKLSAEKIEQILTDRGSPLAGKHMGEFIVQMEEKYGVPAAQFLAQATMESGLGKTGYTQGDHHNIGNLRPGSSWEGPTVSGGSGTFRSYGSWEEGVEDYFKLLSGPMYQGKSLQDQIYTYAPPSENDSSKYYDTVVSLINQWTGS
ncbi:MAG TPA: glucosaminidase domain-containing protein [Stenomitos sp.]